MLQNQENKLLSRSFYQRDTVLVARELIGHILVRRIAGVMLAGIITETEAYGSSDDQASHAYRGQTKRTEPMFGLAGCAYVYFIYGNHFCFNIVAKSNEQEAGAVLIRSIKPIVGMNHMKQWRGVSDDRNITNGPGKLTQALQITTAHNFLDCTQFNELWVIKGESSYSVEQTSRIGISRAHDKPWRFIVREY